MSTHLNLVESLARRVEAVKAANSESAYPGVHIYKQAVVRLDQFTRLSVSLLQMDSSAPEMSPMMGCW